MYNQKLLETVADIAYTAGYYKFSSGDSRGDISTFIFWGEQFEEKHKNTDWSIDDYILSIDSFVAEKLMEKGL